jgi:hypothetical protein
MPTLAALGDAAVAAHTFGADLEAQLSELTLNQHASPAGVLAAETLNQQSELRGEARTTRSKASAITDPLALPAGALPADYGVGLHDDESRSPARPGTTEPRPEQAVRPREPRSPGRTTDHSELLAEGDVLEEEMALPTPHREHPVSRR